MTDAAACSKLSGPSRATEIFSAPKWRIFALPKIVRYRNKSGLQYTQWNSQTPKVRRKARIASLPSRTRSRCSSTSLLHGKQITLYTDVQWRSGGVACLLPTVFDKHGGMCFFRCREFSKAKQEPEGKSQNDGAVPPGDSPQRTLQMRYGRPHIIVRSLIKKVQTLPSVDDKNLIDFAVAVQNLVTIIVTASAHGHMHNPQLMSALVSRLPSSLRLQWGEQVTRDPNRVTLADFSTWLSAKAETLSYVTSETPDSSPCPTAEALLATPKAPAAP